MSRSLLWHSFPSILQFRQEICIGDCNVLGTSGSWLSKWMYYVVVLFVRFPFSLVKRRPFYVFQRVSTRWTCSHFPEIIIKIIDFSVCISHLVAIENDSYNNLFYKYISLSLSLSPSALKKMWCKYLSLNPCFVFAQALMSRVHFVIRTK